MTNWNNIGIIITDESQKEEIISALNELDLVLYSDKDSGVKVTDIDYEPVKNAIQPYLSAISCVIVVNANDTADTANAIVYQVESEQLKKTRSDHSGGENSRYDWFGISCDGITVDGGKYY